MKGQIRRDNTSGKIRLQDNQIFWEHDNKSILEIDINEIIVIGEYTNSDGPYFDDWFLTFITKDGQWKSIPMYAENIDELTQLLADKFHQDFKTCNLADSTDWKSLVRYPNHLKGETLFLLTPSVNYKEAKTFLDKILLSVGLGKFDTTQNIELTDKIKQELQNACR